MIKNKFYEAPEAELLVVRFEENILSGEVLGGSKFEEEADINDQSGASWWTN